MSTATGPFEYNGHERKLLRAEGYLPDKPVNGFTVKSIGRWSYPAITSRVVEMILDSAVVMTETETVSNGLTVELMVKQMIGKASDNGFRPEAMEAFQKAVSGRLGTTHSGMVQKALADEGLWLVAPWVKRDLDDGFKRVKVYAATDNPDLIDAYDAIPARQDFIHRIETRQVNDAVMIDRVPAMRPRIMAKALVQVAQAKHLQDKQFAALTVGLDDDERDAVIAQAEEMFTAQNQALLDAEAASEVKAIEGGDGS